MDDISLFLDHWLITRRDSSTILNGTPEEFEKQLRLLMHDENRKLLRGIHRELDNVKERIDNER